MDNAELLHRIATTLKRDVGPAVVDEYPKTQAFMAAVVLNKLAVQLEHAREHEQAAAADIAQLLDDLASEAERAPATLAAAIEALTATRDHAALCRLVDVLYAERATLGEARFDTLLARVRLTLRADIDRQMVYAA